LALQYNDRAPSFERTVLRSPHDASSGQVHPRHTRGSPYRCSLPGLAGFGDSRCVGPNLQRRSVRLTQHRPPSRGNSTPLKRIAGYRAPLTPRLARPRRNDGGGGGIRTRGTGVTRARHFQCRTFGRSVTPPLRLDPPGRAEDWRRGEDLNPRGTFWAPIRFRVGRLQPGSATPPHRRSGTLTAPRDDHGGYCQDLLASQVYPSGDKPGSKGLPGYATLCRGAGKTCSVPATHARLVVCPSRWSSSWPPSPC